MKSLLIFLFSVNCFVSFGQSVNLGTTYFRNDQYLISFDKVLYPGYILQIENVRKRDFLMGKVISDSLFEIVLPTDKGIDGNTFRYSFSLESYYFGIDNNYHNVCIPIENDECFGTSGIILISGNEITSESYDNISSNFEVLLSSSGTIKRFNKETKNVDIVLIESNFDVETNQIVQNEFSQGSRSMLKNEVTDFEGNIYLTTTIGNQTWMAENLRSTVFNDGTEIPLMTEAQWSNSTAPGIVNKSTEGTFYNFYTLVNDKNVCPQGFHVPNDKDIAELYNTITPYYPDELKISKGSVKKRIYSPLLAPLAVPVLGAVHVGWWGAAATVDLGLLGVAGAADVSLWSLQATAAAIDATLISPFFGWTGKRKQYKKNLKAALNYKFIDENGVPFYQFKNGYVSSELNPVNKSEWDKYKVLEKFLNDSSKTEYRIIENKNKIDSLRNAHIDHQYKVQYDPFVLSNLYAKKFWSTTAWFIGSDYFSEANGLFGAFNILPYRYVDKSYDYYQARYSCSFAKANYQPVLTLLLNKGNDEFSDEYGFNLNLENYISFPNSRNIKSGDFSYKAIKNGRKTGITYVSDYHLPGYFGIATKIKSDPHELNLLENTLYEDGFSGADLFRIQTRVRCVKD
jgi:hypothetical protein